METKVLKRFEVRVEEISGCSDKPTIMVSFYASDGGYIGSIDDFKRLVCDREIMPEKAQDNHNTCSIGKSLKDGKWYGWSHRAIFGFQIGDVVKEGDCCATSGWTDEYLKEHPEENRVLPVGFTAKTEEDCKRMAIAFAESVS
jgi:hypothetical protein